MTPGGGLGVAPGGGLGVAPGGGLGVAPGGGLGAESEGRGGVALDDAEPEEATRRRVPWPVATALGVAAVVAIVLGFAPQLVMELAAQVRP